MLLVNISNFTCRAVCGYLRLAPDTVSGKLVSVMSSMQTCSLHTNHSLCVLDKDVKDKKNLIKSAMSAKHEQISASEDGVDVAGLTDAGITIPTLETHATLIDGVRYDELPIVYIKSTPNNTMMTATNYQGREVFVHTSCGLEGFKNIKKSTNVAAQATGLSLGTKMLKKGIQTCRILIKGLGAGRLASIKGLQMAGVKIVSISDRTPILHSGPRPRKAKRL